LREKYKYVGFRVKGFRDEALEFAVYRSDFMAN
jgi:hypothetical protein